MIKNLPATQSTINKTFSFPIHIFLNLISNEIFNLTIETSEGIYFLDLSGTAEDFHIKINKSYVCRILNGKFKHCNYSLLNFVGGLL